MPYWFDGNNLIGQSAAAARVDRETRRSFLGLLSRIAVARHARFIVYFDGDDTERSTPPRGIRVRYSAPLSTDDAILRTAEGAGSPADIIVVTNDRGLALRCRDAGVGTMDWSRFTSRMSSSRRRGEPAAKQDEKVDLDDWSRYFGLDPRKLK
jgi:hypothetical protein